MNETSLLLVRLQLAYDAGRTAGCQQGYWLWGYPLTRIRGW